MSSWNPRRWQKIVFTYTCLIGRIFSKSAIWLPFNQRVLLRHFDFTLNSSCELSKIECHNFFATFSLSSKKLHSNIQCWVLVPRLYNIEDSATQSCTYASEGINFTNEEEEVFLEDTDNITKKNLTCNFRQLTWWVQCKIKTSH